MLYIKIKEFLYNNKYTLCLLFSLFLYTTDAYAEGATFSALTGAGKAIGAGLLQIIYPASMIGLACVCIAGMFGNFNWKWLAAILIALFVATYVNQTADIIDAQPDIAGAD